MTEPTPGATSHDVRIWKVDPIKAEPVGRSKKPRISGYRLRWSVAGKRKSRNYQRAAQAEARRSVLIAAVSAGIAFDVATGLPVTELLALRAAQAREAAEDTGPTWYFIAVAFVAAKWPGVAPGQRKSFAESLAHVTPALIDPAAAGRPAPEVLREALYRWAFNYGASGTVGDGPAPEPPAHLAAAVAWLEAHTVPLAVLATDRAMVRAALDLTARKLDGGQAAANTTTRKRAVLYGCLEYAVEIGSLASNPIDAVKWKPPRSTAGVVDRRVVVNPDQARLLLAAVGDAHAALPPYRWKSRGPMPLVAFFACMYYSALRPEEVVDLRLTDIALPESDDGWGWFTLERASPETGAGWTDSGSRESRELKHRADGETRAVPIPPPLVALLRAHLADWPPRDDGRVFYAARGGYVSGDAYSGMWAAARVLALTAAQASSPLARRPYDLRHAAVSTWLNGGVQPTQVAEWAGHSVHVLLKVYAKCIDGEVGAQLQRIENALGITRSAPGHT